jgi:hypothetical protein
MLGLFDGDGSVFRSNGRKRDRKPMIGLSIASASQTFLEKVKLLFADELGTKGSVVKNQAIWPHFDSETILNWLYAEKSKVPFLPRKYDKFHELVTARSSWATPPRVLISAIKKELPSWQ